MNSEIQPPRVWWQSEIPWPLAACINMCDNEMDALDMARKADTGQLGDREKWLAAEHRWRTVGVTEHDLRSMSDGRLPFDREIDSAGFPTALSIWPAFRPYIKEVGAFRKLLIMHGEMERCKARTLVAGLLEVCLIGASVLIAPDEAKSPIAFDVAKLQSVFEDLPTGRSVPLHTVVNLLSGSGEEILEFFRESSRREVDFPVYDIRGIFHKEGLSRLEEAFAAASDDQVLVPVFGALAEHGQLPSKFVNVATPELFEVLEQRSASLFIMLAQESWKTDRTRLLIQSVKEIAKRKSANEVHAQIINTLSANRSTGPWFEKFLVEFGKLLSADSYDLRKRYALLLQNALRMRNSGFADAATRNSFNMPTGITELL